MGYPKGMRIAEGVSICIGYCIAYLVLRHFSFDQWFLPAGLRAICLFFLPLRYWPLVIIGDAAAVMCGRIPLETDKNLIWVYGGPLLLIGGISIAPYLLRKRLPNDQAITRRLPMAAAGIAACGAICTVGFNALLGGPAENATFTYLATKFFGNYLGTLMGMLPVLLWHNRRQYVGSLKTTLRDIALATAFVVTLFAYLEYWHIGDDASRKAILMLMICPALFLTYNHGWLGAAFGVFIVNLGIAQTMSYIRTPGAPAPFDETVFLAQTGLSIAASVFLILGARITATYERAVDAGIAEEEAQKISRLMLLSNPRDSKDQVLQMTRLHLLVDAHMRELVDLLKALKRHEDAFAINALAAQHRELFNLHALALYPIGIEKNGLFAVVQSQAFEDRWAADAHLAIRFDDGSPKMLSMELQFAAYYCLCDTFELMSDWKPEEFHVRMRVWRTSTRQGIYFFVSAFNPKETTTSQTGAAASTLLHARVNAHGGIMHRHAHRVNVLLSEKTTGTLD